MQEAWGWSAVVQARAAVGEWAGQVDAIGGPFYGQTYGGVPCAEEGEEGEEDDEDEDEEAVEKGAGAAASGRKGKGKR